MTPDQGLQPVFIVGAQRSGSTMLGSMLGGHPDVLCVPEGQFIAELVPAETSPDPDPVELIDTINGHWRFKVWELDLQGERPDPGTPASYRSTIEWLIGRYGQAVGKTGCPVWIDQQPGHVAYLGRLLRVFPNAKVIHIVRDVRAVAASLLKLDWGPNNAYAAAEFWKGAVGFGFSARAMLPEDRYRWVRYEDLVLDSKSQLKELSAFLGVTFSQQMLGNNGLRLPGFTEHQHRLVGRPPEPARISDWRGKLSKDDISIIEYVTADLLDYLGYEKMFDRETVVSERAKTYYYLENQALKMINRFRFKRRIKAVENSKTKFCKPVK